MTEKEEPSGCAGVAVVLVVGSGILVGVWASAPNFALLAGWAIGTGAVWWCVSNAPNSAPPPPPEGVEEEKPQFIAVDDKDNPHHSVVVWNNEKGNELPGRDDES